MALPEIVRYKAEKELTRYCKERVPLHERDSYKLSFSIRGNSVTLFEEQPGFVCEEKWTKFAVAQFRFSDDNKWALYSRDRRDRWNEYCQLDPSIEICDLLTEVDADPTGIFWG